jgi:chromosome segregation ATPase
MDSGLKASVSELLRLNQDMGNLDQQIQTMREQMQEHRTRMDELTAQIVTLKAVKTKGGSLMQHLEKKLEEVSEKLSKATIDLVGLQEKLMVARIRFQDGVAELSLEKKPDPAAPAGSPVTSPSAPKAEPTGGAKAGKGKG